MTYSCIIYPAGDGDEHGAGTYETMEAACNNFTAALYPGRADSPNPACAFQHGDRLEVVNDDTGEVVWNQQVFMSCHNGCGCDEYVIQDGRLYCPTCREFCTEPNGYPVPPPPYEVDGDGWIFRVLREGEIITPDEESDSQGFVSNDGKRLYLHAIEHDPHGEKKA